MPTPESIDKVQGWRVRAWNDDAVEQRFLEDDLIAIGGTEMPDLSVWPGADAILQILKAALPERPERAFPVFVRYWQTFRMDMRPGDMVVVPMRRRRAAIGVIVGDYQFRVDESDPYLRHCRQVRWTTEVDRSVLDDRVRKVVNAPGTLARLPSGIRPVPVDTSPVTWSA
jgi:restriction system protein